MFYNILICRNSNTISIGLANIKLKEIGDFDTIETRIAILFADNWSCAVSATGYGEDFMRTVLAKHISNLIELNSQVI